MSGQASGMHWWEETIINTSNHRTAGFTLVEALVLVAITGLLLCLVLPPHAIHVRQYCAINIEAIEGAKSLWMYDAKKGDTDVATERDLAPLLKGNLFPKCPQGGVYTINANNVRATCSFHKAAAMK